MIALFGLLYFFWTSTQERDEHVTIERSTEKINSLSTPVENTETQASKQMKLGNESLSLAKKYSESRDMRVFVEFAKNHPELGAWYYAERGLRECGFIRNEILKGRKSYVYGEAYNADQYAQRQQAFERLSQLCQGFLDHEIEEKNRTKIGVQALRAGDRTYALLEELSSAKAKANRDERDKAVLGVKEKIFRTQDPLLMEEFGALLNARTEGNSANFWLDGVSFSMLSDEGRNMSLAWKLIPCSLGMTCDQFSPSVALQCLQLNQCAPNLSELIRMQLLEEGDTNGVRFAQVQAYAQRLKQIIDEGNWDAFQVRH